ALYIGLDLPLLLGELLGLLGDVVGIAGETVGPVLFQQPACFFQPVERRASFTRLATLAGRRAAPHRLGRLLQLPGGVLHFLGRLLASQPFQGPSQLFSFLRQLALRSCPATTLL